MNIALTALGALVLLAIVAVGIRTIYNRFIKENGNARK